MVRRKTQARSTICVGVEKPAMHLEREWGVTDVTVEGELGIEGEAVDVKEEGVRTTYLGRHHGR
jgi:hypothetical protein